eukprot:5730871-Amphidinium_carterae.1
MVARHRADTAQEHLLGRRQRRSSSKTTTPREETACSIGAAPHHYTVLRNQVRLHSPNCLNAGKNQTTSQREDARTSYSTR